MKTEGKSNLKAIIVFIIILAISIAIIQLIGVGIDLIRKELGLETKQVEIQISTTTKEEIIDITEEVIKAVEDEQKTAKYPDYNYFNELNKLTLATNTMSWAKADVTIDEIEKKVVKRFIRVNGNIVNAYLFVNVTVDYGEPLKVWDSVYVSLQKIIRGYEYKPVLGGHLLKVGSLEISKSTTSKYLYDLSNIPVIQDLPYSDNKEPIYHDWLNMLNDADMFEFISFISTVREGAIIHEISIGYECSKETPNCKLEIINSN